MSKSNYDPSLQLALAHEGGFVNHPKDPGGATNKGVTQAVYDAYRRARGLAVQSVRLISDAEVNDIYKKQYWDKVEGDRLPAGIDYAAFDYAINSGVSKSVKDLQRTLNADANLYGIPGQLKVDGLIGDFTVEAACKAADVDEVGFLEAYCARRMSFLRSLKTFPTFGKGWTRRVLGDKPDAFANDGDHGVLDYAVKMAKNDLQFPIAKAELPVAIGDKTDEMPGKAIAADQKVTSTTGGIGAVVAGIGVSGNTVIAAADQVKPYIDDSIFGKLALGAFAAMMMAGIVLLILDFVRKQKEKSNA